MVWLILMQNLQFIYKKQTNMQANQQTKKLTNYSLNIDMNIIFLNFNLSKKTKSFFIHIQFLTSSPSNLMQAPLTLKNKIISNSLLPKTSTPIRARILTNDHPLNSTPINQLKLSPTPNNYHNKQNFDSSNSTRIINHQSSQNPLPVDNNRNNHINSKSPFRTNSITFSEFRSHNQQPNTINASNPSTEQIKQSHILSLSKNSQNLHQSASFTLNNFRSLTPNSIVKDHPLVTSSKQKLLTHMNQNHRKQALLNQSSSTNNLRSSNSFSTIFSARSKTPTRLGSMAFSSISRKNNPSPSENHDILTKTINRYPEEKEKFAQSGNSQASHDSFNNSIVDSGRLMCMNNHNKTAKYRIKQTEEDITASENFVYCSKCAIDMVQKGFSVEQLTQTSQMSQHTSPRQLRESNTFKASFMSFKTSYNSQMLERLKNAERLKQAIEEIKSQFQNKKDILQKKINLEIQTIDCYYDSIVAYVEQQRLKDKTVVDSLRKKLKESLGMAENDEREHILAKYYSSLELVLKSRNFDQNTIGLLQDVERYVRTENESSQNRKNYFKQFLLSEQKRVLTYPTTIQQQFDQFVSYFEKKTKLQFKTFQESRAVSKNSALRFSFQKALQTQNKKKSFISESDVMNPLQEEQQEDYDENSFSHDYMKQTAQSGENNVQQTVFRTLFQDDSILEQDDQDAVKIDMHSPTFKSI